MRFVCFVLLLSAVAISAKFESKVVLNPRYRPTLNLHPIKISRSELDQSQEFQDIVNYVDHHLSASDIQEILDTFPEALSGLNDEFTTEDDSEAMPRSIGDIFERIPWNKITNYLKNMAKSNSKFTKVLNLVNDPKFRDLVKKAVNSHTLGEFVKDVAEHGFSWTQFLQLLLHALCSAATTIQHDKYSVGVCQILQSL